MKAGVDELAQMNGISLALPHVAPTRLEKKALKGGGVMYLPLASGVPSPGGQVWGVRVTYGRSRHEEVAGRPVPEPPKTTPTELSFTNWLGAAIYWAPSDDPQHSELPISREILIKRVANVLGASHPAGTEDSDKENRFDPYIRALHNFTILDSPATYYQLLEIAKDTILAMTKLVPPEKVPQRNLRVPRIAKAIIQALKKLVSPQSLQRTLSVVPEPKVGTRSVMTQPRGAEPFPFIIGTGHLDLLCGKCGTVLLKNVVEGQVSNVVFKCGGCGSFNEAV